MYDVGGGNLVLISGRGHMIVWAVRMVFGKLSQPE